MHEQRITKLRLPGRVDQFVRIIHHVHQRLTEALSKRMPQRARLSIDGVFKYEFPV